MKRWILGLVLALTGCGGGSSEQACTIDRGELPAWATTGFSEPHPAMPHVLGDSGRITAILFGDPLTAPARKDRSNKILWVAKEPITEPTKLTLRASRDGQVVERVVDSGVGPSIVDLPAGCWSIEASWAGHTDTLHLRYAQGRPS